MMEVADQISGWIMEVLRVIKLRDALLSDIAPHSLLGTADMEAYALTIRDAVRLVLDMSENTMVYYNIEKQDEKITDLMALEWRTQFYDSALAPEKKRELVKNTLSWYLKAGTDGAVNGLLETLFGKGKIASWYEYGGQPYHFRVSVHGSPVKDTHNKFKEMLKYVKATRSVLDAVEYIIDFIIRFPEEMDVTKIHMHTQLPFWGCDVLNGTRLLDGSAYVDGKRRYDLVLGIGNGIKIYIKEVMDTDRVCIKILSCFNVHESTSSLKAVFKLGCSGFWKFLNNDVHLKMVLPVRTNVVQAMDVPCIANGSVKVHTKEEAGMASAYIAAVNFWEGSTGQVTVKVRHRATIRVHEAIGDVTVTYRRNLHYVDGAELLDGSRLLNAFYGKEDI